MRFNIFWWGRLETGDASHFTAFILDITRHKREKTAAWWILSLRQQLFRLSAPAFIVVNHNADVIAYVIQWYSKIRGMEGLEWRRCDSLRCHGESVGRIHSWHRPALETIAVQPCRRVATTGTPS